ncbi:hypothetical protein SAMN05216228_10566 [Rhizobium tibeticum]|uniref:Poly-beta-hydroxyalkanoate depolymerase n=1 Tax=Rhizobium tibeticum TaxID=501024 RepID=A0A1H8W8I5_9HYPH|nr:Poly-beta-hydroxyalkanoate depolymerase [Rhizobium tibeticum]SEP23448.1 hypothetical protein SAMN05216228_10566 [Rhizobium tibeticum]
MQAFRRHGLCPDHRRRLPALRDDGAALRQAGDLRLQSLTANGSGRKRRLGTPPSACTSRSNRKLRRPLARPRFDQAPHRVKPQPKLLVVARLSGHSPPFRAAQSRPSSHHFFCITDWPDARMVPLSQRVDLKIPSTVSSPCSGTLLADAPLVAARFRQLIRSYSLRCLCRRSILNPSS